MSATRRLLHALLVGLLLALALPLGALAADPQPAPSGTVSPANQAIAINQENGENVFQFAFSIKQVVGDAVAPTNLALAYAQCSHCQTIAIAIQIILVQSNAHNVQPQNQAVAVNYQCTACDTLAYAYQFVIETGYPVHITERGMHQIRQIERHIRELEDSGLTALQIKDQVKALVTQLQTVLQTEVVPDQPKSDGEIQQELKQQQENSQTPSPQSSAPSSASPSGSPNASPSASPSSFPSSSPSAPGGSPTP